MNSPVSQLLMALDGYRRKALLATLFARALLVLAWGCGLLTLLNVIFALFPWAILPWLWDGVVVVMALLMGGSALDVVLLRPLSRRSVARQLESQARKAHPKIALALELSESAPPAASAPFVAMAVQQALDALPGYPQRIAGIVSKPLLTNAVAALVAASLSMLLIQPRLVSFWNVPFMAARGVAAQTWPGSIDIARGASVVLRCQPRGERLPAMQLTLTPLGSQSRSSLLLRPDSAGHFARTLDSVTTSLSYRFTVGATHYGTDTIRVIPPPRLERLRLTLYPPRYSGQSARALTQGQGNFATLAGSRVRFVIGSHYALAEAFLVAGQSDTVRFDCQGDSAVGELQLKQGLSYSFVLVDTLGQRTDSLPPYYAEVIADEPPVVHILKPATNALLRPEQQETLYVEGLDDIGVGSMGFSWYRSGEDTTYSRSIALRGSPAVARATVAWDLVPLGLYPGDTVYFWASARDNSPQAAARVAYSDTLWFRVPGFGELHKQISQKGERFEERLEAVRDEQKKLKQQLRDLVRSTQGKRELSWEQKQLVDDVEQHLEQQRDSLSEALKTMQEMVDQMKQEGYQGEAVLDKMEEIRKTVQELVRQYGDSLFVKKEEQRNELSFEDMHKALQKMQEMLPQLQERLKNTLKYLQALKKDQQLLAMATQYEKLAQEQHRIGAQPPGQQQRDAQRQMLDNAQKLSHQLHQQMQAGEQQLLKPSEAPGVQQADSLAQAMATTMRGGQMPQAGAMQRMSGAMLNTAQQLRSAMSSAMMVRMQREQQQLLDMAADALELAQWQKQLAGEVGEGANMQEAARAQQALAEALRNSRARLDSLSMVAPEALMQLSTSYAKAQQSMQRALGAMQGEGAQQPMNQAGAQLNAAAQALLGANKAMMQGAGGQGEGGEGFGGQMRKLSGKQAAINAATGEMLHQMLGGSQPGEGQGGKQGQGQGPGGERARAEAARAQQALSEELRRLGQQYGDKAGAGGEGRMRELAQEAQRLAKMLENPTPALGQQQEQFLSRMLQSTLSVHRQGEGKEQRKSEGARLSFSPLEGSTPVVPQNHGDADSFYRLRNRALEGNVPREYLGVVKSYFDSLGVLFLGGKR